MAFKVGASIALSFPDKDHIIDALCLSIEKVGINFRVEYKYVTDDGVVTDTQLLETKYRKFNYTILERGMVDTRYLCWISPLDLKRTSAVCSSLRNIGELEDDADPLDEDVGNDDSQEGVGGGDSPQVGNEDEAGPLIDDEPATAVLGKRSTLAHLPRFLAANVDHSFPSGPGKPPSSLRHMMPCKGRHASTSVRTNPRRCSSSQLQGLLL
jgi:hypothetical protein